MALLPATADPAVRVPVKIVIERRARPGADHAFRAWAERFVNDARRAPGHEGGSVLSAPGNGGAYVILLRFGSVSALENWQQSSAYRKLMQDADLVSSASEAPQVRSGFETWFMLPGTPVPMTPPPRWKMALVTWLSLLPMVIALGYLLSPLRLPSLVQAAASTAIPVVMLTWVVMPRVSRLLYRWLYAS